MIKQASEAGVPRDQLERFLKYQYIPLPWQMRLHAKARECDKEDGPVDLGAGGARGPGKSHSVFAQVTLDDCQRVPNLKGLFLRQTGKAAEESFEDLIMRVVRGKVAHEHIRGMLKFKNGSRVLLGGFRDERDIDSYIGIEYDVIAVEEINQLTQRKVDMLKGSLRTSKKGWRPRLYTSFNPGGVGHQYIKSHFVDPYREKRATKSVFIPSTYKENPYLNKEYIEYLEGLTGNLGRAWREGNFDIFEGMFFTEWDYNKHTCEPFRIPDSWKKYRTIDYGRTNPFACYWVAVDYDGNVWIYNEHYQAGVDADVNAKDVVKKSHKHDKNGLPLFKDGEPAEEKYEYTVADSSIFTQTGHGETIAQILGKNGIPCLPSHKDRIARWNIFHQYLRINPKTGEPRLKIFNTCKHAIRTIPLCIHDEKKPEDLDGDFHDDELDVEGVDHAADAVGYLLQTLRDRKAPKPENLTQRRLREFKKSIGESENFSPGMYRDEVVS